MANPKRWTWVELKRLTLGDLWGMEDDELFRVEALINARLARIERVVEVLKKAGKERQK